MEELNKIEIWKDIPNFEGIYRFSSLCRVESLERMVDWNGTRKTVKRRFLN